MNRRVDGMAALDSILALSNGLVQSSRLVKLDTPLGNNVLLPQRVVGHSRIGRDGLFTVDALSTSDTIELKTLIAQPVTLWILQSDQSYLPHHGYVHKAARLGSDGNLGHYQIGFASWLNFLRFRSDARIWQDKTADLILTDVFNQHPQAQGAFRFDLRLTSRQPVQPRSYCVQYEDDWNFCMRLMEQEGWYCYIEQTDGKSHTVVITDTLDAFPALSPQTVSFYRAGTSSETNALVQWSGERTLQSTTLTTRTFDYKAPGGPSSLANGTSTPTLPNQGNLPSQTEVYEYSGSYTFGQQSGSDNLAKIRMEEWESRSKRFFGSGGVRNLDAGYWFELTDCPGHSSDSQANRQFGIIETQWFIENNLPVSDTSNFLFSLKPQVDEVKAQQATPAGGLSILHPDGSQGFFLAQIEVQRKAIPYHSPFEHPKPEMSLQTAIVVGPANQEVYTDELNRVKVQMHWDHLNPGDENASSWVRVAYSNAGDSSGGVHVPRIGEEVVISFLDNDGDRPLVTSRVYNGSKTPSWHSNGLLSGYQSKEHQGAGFNQLVMDDATGQNRTQLFSTSSNSHLHLGYLIDQNGNSRGNYLGSGFDLKTESYGALRAGQGLYVTTYPASMGSQPFDARPASSQLINSESLLESMSEASEAHQAESLKDGYDALKTFTDATQTSIAGTTSGGITAGGGTGNANGFKDPIMLLASPAGIALSTQKSNQIYAGEQINVVSGQSTFIATGKSLVASIAEKISLFVQNAGMKVFAAKGKIEIQAHSGNIELTAQKTLSLVSATDSIEAAAKQEIFLTAGGAYIRISDGNIEMHAPGLISIKGTQHSFSGPTSLARQMNTWPATRFEKMVTVHLHNGTPARNRRFELIREDGSIMRGTTNSAGEIGLQKSDLAGRYRITILD